MSIPTFSGTCTISGGCVYNSGPRLGVVTSDGHPFQLDVATVYLIYYEDSLRTTKETAGSRVGFATRRCYAPDGPKRDRFWVFGVVGPTKLLNVHNIRQCRRGIKETEPLETQANLVRNRTIWILPAYATHVGAPHREDVAVYPDSAMQRSRWV